MKPERYLLINDGSSKFISKKFTVESSHDSDRDSGQVEIKRINYFIGKNNSGKSLFLRWAFSNRKPITPYFTSTKYIQDYHDSISVGSYWDAHPTLPDSKSTNQDQLEKLMDLIREIHGNQDYWIDSTKEEIKNKRKNQLKNELNEIENEIENELKNQLKNKPKNEIENEYQILASQIENDSVDIQVDDFLKFTKIPDIIKSIKYRCECDSEERLFHCKTMEENIYLHKKLYKKTN